ncbi:MAG: STAS-like domain-containing protein [Fusobacteriaceae bacterium]
MILVLHKFLKTGILVSPEKAKKVKRVIVEMVKNKKEITLDFTEIKTISLSFIYFLFDDMSKELRKTAENLIKIKNPTVFLYDEIEYLRKNYNELSIKFKKYELQYVSN